MSDFNSFEFTVEQAKEGKWKLARIGMVCLYILYAVAVAVIIGVALPGMVPLFALVPVTLWIIIFFTWRYVSVEYEYSIISGELTFSKIYGGRSRREVMKMRVRDASLIAPLDGDVYSAKATAYTGDPATASGRKPMPGHIAVDPKEYPYGTELYVVSADGSYVYGYCIAADTGGFVKMGNTDIDLYMDNEDMCNDWGNRGVKIYVLN
jgi:3D (Asp-Asp-Asp) domain-containing protein